MTGMKTAPPRCTGSTRWPGSGCCKARVEARYAGGETLRGTPCRKVVLSKILLEMGKARPRLAASAKEDPAEFTVWIDEEHIRQVTTGAVLSGKTPSLPGRQHPGMLPGLAVGVPGPGAGIHRD